MSKLICIQAGHYPRTTGATGAPGEQELTWRITLALTELLKARGFVIQIVGADPTDAEIKKDFDLFISLHGEADVHNMDGGMISEPAPEIDSANAESKRIRESIESVYFKESGIVNRPQWISRGMKYYYMWKRLSAKTPCVILEMGVVQNAHDKVILADTKMVSVAIAKGICKAFGVNYEPTPTPTPQPQPPADPCEGKNKEISRLKGLIDSNKLDFEAKLALKDKECQEKLSSYKSRLAVRLENDLKTTITKVLEEVTL